MKMRVGLIGLGHAWESRHCPALRSLSDRFQVIAVCGEVAQRSEAVAREFRAVSLDGFRVMIERNDIDAVLVLSTDWVGHLPILAACDAGKAVYAAAPLDIEPTQVDEIRRRVDESGIAFMAELPRRHAPATLRLKELIATRLGPPRLLFCHERLTCEDRMAAGRRGFARQVALRNLMELVDWCRYVVGHDPSSVIAARNQGVVGGTPSFYQSVSLDFSRPDRPEVEGPIAQLSIGHYLPARWREALPFRRPASLQVCCENGIAFIDLPSTLIWFDDAGQHSESLETERPVGEQLLTHFHRAVTSLIRKTSDLEDAYKALTVVNAAGQSISEERRIRLTF
ncbi:MAG TPA: Gfo/Idh/MocA family oxidoreductase [Pirellulaceae bacterium]|nr:Gfo/Idh/MocA family oxidoreductase [Pirellulaceae bacterium]